MNETGTGQTVAPIGLPVRPPRRRWRTILLAVVLLICGGVIGAGLTLVTVMHRVQYAMHHPEDFPTRAAERLRRSLALSPPQTRAVEAILRRRQAALQEIRRETRPRVEAEIDAIQKEVSAVLTESQVRKWNQWMTDKRKLWLPTLPTLPEAATPKPG